MTADLVGVIEAAYRADLPERPWLKGLVQAARPLLDEGAGLFACLHDSDDPAGFRFRSIVGSGIAVENWARLFNLGVRKMDPAQIEAALRGAPCATVSETVGQDFLRANPYTRQVARFGVLDGLAIRGADPDGHGVVLGVPLPAMRQTPPDAWERWSKVAAHLAAGLRLRRRVAELARGGETDPLGRADAILEPDGRLAHAEREAREAESQAALRTAAIAIDKARGRLRREDPLEAVAAWTALIDGRWTVFEHFDHDGRRFLLAERNPPAVPACRPLTERERQVLAYVAMGQPNKLIAYQLGLSVSTVASHVSSAAAKLGAASRVELIRRFQGALPADPAPAAAPR